MTATPYRAVTWQPDELISDNKMNTIVNNVQWLYEHSPRALYTTANLTREEGVRIACGKVAFQKRKKDQAIETVHFNNFFSRLCQPVITTGVVSNGQKKIFAVHYGLTQLHPDHQGFRLSVEIAAEAKKRDKIAKQFWVSWIAMGF